MFIKSCLTKEYPEDGPFAGGIVFKRCYGQGSGIGFTREECEQMWSGIKLNDHIMVVHGETNDSFSASSSAAVDSSGSASSSAAANNSSGSASSSAAANNSSGSASATTGTACVRPGDSIEIWCDNDELFKPCIVTQMRSTNENGTAWKCRYDDTTTPYWHDLETEQYRRMPPSVTRLKKLRMKELRWRLRQDGVTFLSSAKKDALVAKLFEFMNTAESAAANPPIRIGDCLQVWWDEPEGFWGCVVAEQKPDVRSTTASYCLYDDGEKRWHNLEREKIRIIPPSNMMLCKLDSTVIRDRLLLEQVNFRDDANEAELVELLYSLLRNRFQLSSTATTTVSSTVATTTDSTATLGIEAEASAAATTDISIVDTHCINEGSQEVRAGDSIEVWWDEPEGFWGCVVADQAPDVQSTTASYCVYDDGEKR